jgi:hypothetical protein
MVGRDGLPRSVVTGGTVGWRTDALGANALQIALDEVCGLHVAHGHHLVHWTQIEFGLAMALKTPSHRERLDLRDDLHLVYTAVTRLTSNPPIDVGGMAEDGVVGEVMNLYPLDGLVIRPTLTHGEKSERFRLDLPVAVHACLGGRHPGMIRNLNTGVAVLATNAKLTGMKTVTVLYRLRRGIPDVSEVRREEVPHQKNEDDPGEERSHKREEREHIGPLRKDLRHTD